MPLNIEEANPEENINSNPDLLDDENTQNTQKENKPDISPALKRKFLLKSFAFLFIFNLVVSIPVLVLWIIDKAYYNIIALCIFAGLLIVFSGIAEFQPYYFFQNTTLCYTITVLYGLSLMGFYFFFPSPKYHYIL